MTLSLLHPTTRMHFLAVLPRRFLTSVSISRSILTPLSLKALSNRLRESSASLSLFSAFLRFLFSNCKDEEGSMQQIQLGTKTQERCEMILPCEMWCEVLIKYKCFSLHCTTRTHMHAHASYKHMHIQFALEMCRPEHTYLNLAGSLIFLFSQ